MRGRTDLCSKQPELLRRLLFAVGDPEHIHLGETTEPTMADPDPARKAVPPPPSPVSRKRSSGPISPSNRTKSSSSGIGKAPSSGQINSSPAMSEISSDYPKSDVFSAITKLEVKRLSGDSCWACETESPQIAHVVAKEDKQVSNGVSTVSHKMWISQQLDRCPYGLRQVSSTSL